MRHKVADMPPALVCSPASLFTTYQLYAFAVMRSPAPALNMAHLIHVRRCSLGLPRCVITAGRPLCAPSFRIHWSLAVPASLEVAERRPLDCNLDGADCPLGHSSPLQWLAYLGYLGVPVTGWSPLVRAALLDACMLPSPLAPAAFHASPSPP